MPIPFSSIPEHIRMTIVQKLDVHDIGQFKESSRISYKSCTKLRTKLMLSVENNLCVEDVDGGLMFRFMFFGVFAEVERRVRLEVLKDSALCFQAKEIRIDGPITQERCVALSNILQATNSRFGCLRIESVNCAPEEFNRLLLASKAHKFVCFEAIPKEIVKIPAMKNITDMEINCFLDDEDILPLKMPRMKLSGTNASNSGINLIVKEWTKAHREVIEVTISTRWQMDLNAILDGTPRADLKASEGEKNTKASEKKNKKLVLMVYTYPKSVRLAPEFV